MSTLRCPHCRHTTIDTMAMLDHRTSAHQETLTPSDIQTVSTGPEPLDELTEKEILIEIFRETRATRRILMWVLIILPLAWAVLATIGLILDTR